MKFSCVFLFATVALGAGDGPALQSRRLDERYSKKKYIANTCSNQIVESITGKLGSDLIEQFEGGCAGGRNKLVPFCSVFDLSQASCDAAYRQNATGVKTVCTFTATACKGRSNPVEFCNSVTPNVRGKCLNSYKEEDGTKCEWDYASSKDSGAIKITKGWGSCVPGNDRCTASTSCTDSGGTCTNPDDEQRQDLYDELLKEAVYTCCLNGKYFSADDKAGYGKYGDYDSQTRAEECEDIAKNLPDFLA